MIFTMTHMYQLSRTITPRHFRRLSVLECERKSEAFGNEERGGKSRLWATSRIFHIIRWTLNFETRSFSHVLSKMRAGCEIILNRFEIRFHFYVTTKYGSMVPAPLACTTRSGIRSLSKWLISSINTWSWSKIGPFGPAVNVLDLLSTGAPAPVVTHCCFCKWLSTTIFITCLIERWWETRTTKWEKMCSRWFAYTRSFWVRVWYC